MSFVEKYVRCDESNYGVKLDKLFGHCIFVRIFYQVHPYMYNVSVFSFLLDYDVDDSTPARVLFSLFFALELGSENISCLKY